MTIQTMLLDNTLEMCSTKRRANNKSICRKVKATSSTLMVNLILDNGIMGKCTAMGGFTMPMKR